MTQVEMHTLSVVAENRTKRPNTVVLMAGGFGSRLGELTRTVPKPLIPVGGRPVLERIICRMRAMGLSDYVITTHYLPEKIRSHCRDGSHWDCDIRYVQESAPLGTAGGLALIGEVGPDPVLVCNADILTDIDYADLLRVHDRKRAALTIVTVPYRVTVPFGVLGVTPGGDVTEVREKPTYSYQVSAGTYVIDPVMFDLIGVDERLDMPEFIERVRTAGGRIAAYAFEGYWLDIGRPDDLQRAARDMERAALAG